MPKSKQVRILLSLPMFAMTMACATNALRIEYASDVAKQGNAVAAVSGEYLAAVERARYAVNADIIAADPACRQSRAVLRNPPASSSVTDPRNPPRGWFCEQLASDDTRLHGVMLGPIDEEMRPTLELVRSLAAYSAAITKILDAPQANPVQDLENALAAARSAENLLRTLRNSNAPTLVPAADDARLQAVTGFIGFLSELRNEQITVGRLRDLRARGGGGIALVTAIDNHLARWEQSRVDTERLGFALSNTLLNAAAREGSPLNAAQRRAYAEDYYSRARSRTASRQLFVALDIAVDGLREAEADYQNLLDEHPRLNREMRARRAEIIRQRLIRAFDLAVSLITSFRGV